MGEVKLLLHDDNAEKYVVGGLLNSQDLFYSVSDRLKPQLFYNNKYGQLVKVIIEIYREGKIADLVTVANYLTSHPDINNPDMYELALIFESCLVSGFAEHFSIVESLYNRRRYFELGTRLMEFGTNPLVSEEKIKGEINSLLNEDQARKQRVKSMRDANKELKEHVLRNYDGSSDTMIPTGIKEIDERGGLQTGDFDVIGAERSMGKTTFLMTIAKNAAKKAVPSMIFSMEMESYQIAARLAAPDAKMSSGIIQYKKLNDWQLNELSQAIKKNDELPIYFDDESTINIDSIIASIRLNVKRLGVKLVGIDYLQILGSTGHINNQEQFYGEVCRRLKNLAKELKICIVVLSQMTKDVNNPKPTLNRLRGSGQISDAADDVIFIWRPSLYGKGYEEFDVDTKNTAEIIFGKGRNKGTFNFIVGFNGETTEFYNYEGEVKRYGKVYVNSETKTDSKEQDQELPFQQEVQPGQLPF